MMSSLLFVVKSFITTIDWFSLPIPSSLKVYPVRWHQKHKYLYGSIYWIDEFQREWSKESIYTKIICCEITFKS